MHRFFLTGLVFALIGCSGSQTAELLSTPTTGLTTIWVDETFAPIVESEIAVFEGIYSQANIIAYDAPEVDALNALLKDTTQLVLATRKLTGQEHAFFLSKQYVAKEIKVAEDAIAIIVHPSNPCIRITTEALQKIVTGKLVFWNQLDPSFAWDSIKVIFDSPASSTVRYVVEEIAKTPALSPSLSALGGNQQVLDYVRDTPNAMGIIGVSWVSNSKDTSMMSFKEQIKVLEVSRATEALYRNSYLPFQYYISTREYPLCRDVYLILTEPRHGLATGFSSFMASDRGQRIILKAGIFPATQPVRAVHIREKL